MARSEFNTGGNLDNSWMYLGEDDVLEGPGKEEDYETW